MPDPMPPLGPPYGPAGPPPPARFPEHPPTEWGARPLEPLPTPPPPPPGDHRARFAVVVAVIAATAMLIAVLAYARSDGGPSVVARPRPTTTTAPGASSDSSGGQTDSSSTGSSSGPAAAGSAQLDQVVADIKHFVERQRGLTFKSDVAVHPLDDQAFNAELLQEFDEGRAQTLEEEEVLKSLGLVDRTRDVVADMHQLLSIGVGGYYNPKTKRLAVRGTTITPLRRQIIAHELTHALDDQWFNLDRSRLDTADDETGFGFSTLVEGSARTVEQAYYDNVLTHDEQAQADAERQSNSLNPTLFSLPTVLLLLLEAPYDAGETLVSRIEQGGSGKLNDAFASPPVTSEQALEPDKYVAGEIAVHVSEPQPPGSMSASNRGALGVLLLQQLLGNGRAADVTSIDPALLGWGGDRYVTWVDGDRTCIEDVVVGDDSGSTSTLLQRFQDWASSAGVSATVAPLTGASGSPFSITSCSL